MVALLLMLLPMSLAAQNLAPTYWRAMTGKTCKNETDFSQLKGFVFSSGKVISGTNDPEQKQVHVFTKGLTAVIFFVIRQDDSRLFILDAVEITNQMPDQEVIIGTCKDGTNAMPGIVALIKNTSGRRQTLKAWYFNLDKLTVKIWPSTRVICLADQGKNN
jgi:hypothetical protein